MGMDGVNDLLEGGELVWEDYDGEEGCGECNAPGSKCTVTLEVNREGALRLVAARSCATVTPVTHMLLQPNTPNSGSRARRSRSARISGRPSRKAFGPMCN